MAPVLKCPHCSGVVSLEATVCPGCGATKKTIGGGRTKFEGSLLVAGAGILGAGVAAAIKWYAFPENSGVGDWTSAMVMGAAAGGLIVRYTALSESDNEAKPLAVWEKRKT